MSSPAIVVLGARAHALGLRLQAALPGSRVHGLAGRVAGADETFADTAAHLRRLFQAGIPIVGVCASGILVRALAPLLADKRAEPPVVAVAEDGVVAVPLLGGHHGANALARAAAAATGGVAAITTAGEVSLGIALDEPPAGWRVANPDAAKAVMAALLAGAKVGLRVEAGEAGWLAEGPFADDGEVSVIVTDRARDPGRHLVLYPPVLAIGVGCERGAEADALMALVEGALADAGLAAAAVACVASLDVKMDEPAVHALAHALGVPARFFARHALAAQEPRLATPSEAVRRAVGVAGVAEAAALAAAGADAELAVAKRTGARVTCAIARAARAIDAYSVGRPRGRLFVVGIGPGAAAWRTAEMVNVLGECDAIVGYALYLDLVADLTVGKETHASALSEEETRVRAALDLAAAGRTVALVSSGDAGIYGLAALVFELIDREGRAKWERLDVTVVPGVSALQAAAARIGAPLGHDFCAISLSDLLTPWQVIERRLEAAGAGDFVVALYNPASGRRRTQLARARDILLAHRAGETPVVLARNLGRAGERVEATTLAQLAPERVDMLTLVLVGNRETRARALGGSARVYTPRGYAAKRASGAPLAGRGSAKP